MSIKNSKKNRKNGKPSHIVFLCHILPILVDKHGLHAVQPKNHVSNVISQILGYKFEGEDKRFRVWNMKSFKNLTKASFWSE